MSEEQNDTVEYERRGSDSHFLSMGGRGLHDIQVDLKNVPQDQRGPSVGIRLLSASALYCLAVTLGNELTTRGATIKSLTGRVTSEKTRDDYYRAKVARLNIKMDVDVDDADLPILEECRGIMKDGCLMTYSLNEGIGVEQVIRGSG